MADKKNDVYTRFNFLRQGFRFSEGSDGEARHL